jgi:protein-disulfide isomerase
LATAGLGTIGLVAGMLPPFTLPAMADDLDRETILEELAESPPYGDVVIGSDKAPVTVIEYASLTSPQCAHFQAATFPELKKRYIDIGKVRYMMREFMHDEIDATAFMLALCAGKDRYQAVVETLLARQSDWMRREPIPPLMAIAKQFGFTEAWVSQCWGAGENLANQKLLDEIRFAHDHAEAWLRITSTPTFFVNGKRLVGDLSIDRVAKEVDPYLNEK